MLRFPRVRHTSRHVTPAASGFQYELHGAKLKHSWRDPVHRLSEPRGDLRVCGIGEKTKSVQNFLLLRAEVFGSDAICP